MKTHVARITITLAATLGITFGPATALAQNPSYKERGYGGPLYVGPNFEQGGQHTPPNYGNNPAKKRVIKETAPPPAKKPRDVAKAPKPQPPAKQETEKEQATTTRTVPSSAEEATPSTATEDSASTATTTAATCKKFDSTAGQTITVPCN
jgi:hypothetical protein